jgi:Bax protein
MRSSLTAAVAVLAFLYPASGTTQADYHTAEGLLAGRQGLRWARSAVVPFHISARPAGPGFVNASFGRGGTTLPDFEGYEDIQTKKLRFFSWLLPLVDQENARLLDLRKRLDYIEDHRRWGHELDAEDRAWLAEVTREFGLDGMDPADEEFWTVIRRRIDALPDRLVLVQAANESAWGTSRFAREGNNLFGQWCFREGCGIVPANRPEGEIYEVARFDSVDESVASYMHNLNTGRVYQELREIRAAARESGLEPEASDLAEGLERYSERGQEYIDELRAMIRHNDEVIEEARRRLDQNS